ncbi:glycan-binding surface protein [Chitinophaga vietnamensis]|uniref:glycan-binding surface protein n=1 Tax=Chitinophaga vietnamensis TaxID=2593957 RepID=UPI00117888C8|nr:glycan-binding surface protein [Chitinophaga vietnamensis]
MNKLISNSVSRLLLWVLAGMMALLQAACKKDGDGGGPLITHVRNYAATPGDTLLTSVLPGQWVVLCGHHLQGALAVTFNGVPASIKSVMFSDTSAVMQVPAVIPFPSISADNMNVIRYVTSRGTTTFKFSIVAPPPVITGVSNENANAGDSVYIYGTNFFFTQQVMFAGQQINNFTAAGDGASIGFILPQLSHSGKVTVITKSGADSTAYNVNDLSTGMLCNFDDINPFSWGTNLENTGTDFPGNKGNYAVLKNDVLAGGDGSWWNNQRSINTNEVQWVPRDSLQAPLDRYALKFEINVPSAWNGTTLYVVRNYSRDYMARYEPWQSATGTAANYVTKGWRTVTIPFSSFRSNDGKGVSAADLTTLLTNTGAGPVNIQTANFSASPTATGFYAAIDNIRVVKIKR